MSEAIAWYVVIQVAAIAVWPLLARACGAYCDDRGWAASKAAGLLIVAWLVWLVCMLTPLPFSRVTLAIATLAIGACAWGWVARRGPGPDVLVWLQSRRWLVLSLEAVMLCGFVLFAALRSHSPAVVNTEKPMDMAFLNGFIAAPRLPTQDTWLAGFGVPYYHFGYFVLACAAKLAATSPGVAYNLAATSVPVLAMVLTVGLVWNLARAARVQPIWAAASAAVATLLGLFAGNLSTFFDFLFSRGLVAADAGATLGIKNFAEGITRGQWPPANSFWWFRASRVMPDLKPDGINEFPFFSGLLSDLHPHFVALPFELLVLSIASTHVLSRGETLRSPYTQGLAAVALGGLLVINTWDIAPFWLLYVGLSLVGARWLTWRWRWLAAVATPLGGAVLFAPYVVGYGGPPLGLGIVAERTGFPTMLVLFGWAMVLLAALGVFMRWCLGDRHGWQFAGVGVLAGVALAILGQPTLGVLLVVLALLVPAPGVLDRLEPASSVAVAIGGFAAVMLLGVEVIYLDDVFHSRMNTVFKFHMNAWLLAAVAAGLGVGLIGEFTRRARWLVSALAVVVLAAGLVYPVTAIATRMAERPGFGLTLDGLAFMAPDDRAAVRWLADQNVSAGQRVVIAEAAGDEYSFAARMATYSGAVAVMGWAGHELQWRGPLPELAQRDGDLAALYRDALTDGIRPILDRYNVRFVVVGDIERQKYGDGVDTRFEGVLPLAVRMGAVTIYRAR